MTTILSAALVDFIESGVSMCVGGCDGSLRPFGVRAVGAAVAADRQGVTVFVPTALSEPLLRNLAEHGRVALTLSRPIDHRTLQLKGAVLEIRPSRPKERALQERYLAGFVEQLYCVGLPRGIIRRVRTTPSSAISFRVDQVFDQTPGPHAGQRVEADASERA